MKKLTLSFIALIFLGTFSFAGGLVTNTNASAAWARYFSRNATLEIDGVFFNPAGLTKMNDGFHFSLNNQSIFQTWTLGNDLGLMNTDEFVGDVKAPMYPSVYAAYKTGKFAFSFGFNIIGGGGGAEFTGGIPMVEMIIASAPGALSALGTDGSYAYDSYLKGQSAYFGYQAGVTYELNDMISLYAGARYVTVNNSYDGYIRNITLGSAIGDLTNGSLTTLSEDAYAASAGFQAATGAGFGSATIADLVGAGMISAEDGAQMEMIVTMLGYDPAVMTASMLDPLFATVGGSVADAAGQVADQELETSQSGSGITPIIGANVSLMDGNLNIGLKYEFKTNLDITNETAHDVVLPGGSMYPDGAVISADMPALLSGGVSFRPMEKLELAAGFEYYFDDGVDWDGREEFIESNLFNVNFSAQYAINEKFLVSAGYNYSKTGVTDDYQTDLSFSLNTSSIGFGAAWNVMENLQLNLGYAMVMYQEGSVDQTAYTSTYLKETNMLAVGVNYSF